GLRERAVSVSGISKTFRVSGWRIGYAIADPSLTRGIRKAHDLMTAGVSSPLQSAAVRVLQAEPEYYSSLVADHQHRRDVVTEILEERGFICHPAQGSCFMMASVENFGFASGVEFVHHLMQTSQVVMAPGSFFCSDEAAGRNLVRVCFVKTDATIEEARTRIAALPQAAGVS
ncbi:MAG TPA: aminotransferase class I/II-fold pyridoxal phosphate-dependent enzyme, partial [Longimicrobium sp.]